MAPHEKFGVCLRTSAPSAATLSAHPPSAPRRTVLRRPGPRSLYRQRLRRWRVQEAGDQGGRLRAGLADAGAARLDQAGRDAARRARAGGRESLDPERAARLQAQSHRSACRGRVHDQRHRRPAHGWLEEKNRYDRHALVEPEPRRYLETMDETITYFEDYCSTQTISGGEATGGTPPMGVVMKKHMGIVFDIASVGRRRGHIVVVEAGGRGRADRQAAGRHRCTFRTWTSKPWTRCRPSPR